MGQRPSSEAALLKSELSRLYRRRLVVDELIRSLERYAACDARYSMQKVRKNVTTFTVRHIA